MKKIVVTLLFLILIASFLIGKFLTQPKVQTLSIQEFINPSGTYLTKLSALGKVLPNPDLQNGVLTATLSSGLTIVMDINNPKPNWETVLQSIINRSKINGVKPNIIDMRFKSPIITYGQK